VQDLHEKPGSRGYRIGWPSVDPGFSGQDMKTINEDFITITM